MSLADEMLNTLVSDGVEPHIVVGTDRKIMVPDVLKRIAVQNDHNIETVTFDCPRYWDGYDLSMMNIYINYLLSNNAPGCFKAENVVVDEDDDTIIHFTWTVSRNVTSTDGNIQFQVCAKSLDMDNEEHEITHWNSEISKDMYVSKGLDCSGYSEDVEENYPDVINQLVSQVDGINEEIDGMSESLENINNLGSDNKLYGENNFVSGINNSVGTKGFKIGKYAGIVGEYGAYRLFLSQTDWQSLNETIEEYKANGKELYYSITNNMWLNYWGKILALADFEQGGYADITVDNFYTNKGNEGEHQRYEIVEETETVYSKSGYPYSYAPELGYTINVATLNRDKDTLPSFMICDHPELGTHDLSNTAISFGINNINQGCAAFTAGNGNRVYADLGSAHGENNQVGYDTHAMGRLNHGPSAQDCFMAGFANTIRGFVNSGVTVVGAHNIASRDGQFVAGIMNNNKKKNLFEIGGGKFPNIHHNAFEVDEDGIVYSNEQPLPFQKIINKTLSPSIDILGGVYTAITGRDLIGNSVSFSPSKYFAHLRIDCTKVPLTVGDRYCLVVGFTLNADSGSDISQLELKNSTYDSTSGVKHRSIDFHGAKIGKNYLIYPFAHEDWYEEIGLYGYMPSTGFSGSIRYDSVSLYPMDEIAPDYPDYSFSVDDIGIIHRTIEKVSGQNFVKYHSVIQTNPLEKEYLLADVAKMNTGSFQGLYSICPNATCSVNVSVYSGNEATAKLLSK